MKRLLTLLLILLILAALCLVVSSITITAPMETLRAANLSHTPKFKQLHAYSMLTHTLQASLLLLAAVLLPTAPRNSKITPAPPPQTT